MEEKSGGTGKHFLPAIFIIFSILFLVLLFVFRDNLNRYASKSLREQVGTSLFQGETAFIDSAFNYRKNALPYTITFLEFGSTGCSACRKMEEVMQEIKATHSDKINVVFMNVLLPENLPLLKYYGVTSIPMQIFLNRDGKEIFRHSGYLSAEEILQNLTLN